MRGKSKCKILKEIRKRIAEENDIPFVTSECTYQGECSGTCPRCEAELRYLEQQLERRKTIGKAVAVAAAAVSLTLTSGCVPGGEVSGKYETVPSESSKITTPLKGEISTYELTGDVPYIQDEREPLMGRIAYEEPLATEDLPVETIPVVPENAEGQADAG